MNFRDLLSTPEAPAPFPLGLQEQAATPGFPFSGKVFLCSSGLPGTHHIDKARPETLLPFSLM